VIHVYTFTTDVDSYMQLEEGVVRPYFGEHPPPSTVGAGGTVDRPGVAG
jgi:hypothetical protein